MAVPSPFSLKVPAKGEPILWGQSRTKSPRRKETQGMDVSRRLCESGGSCAPLLPDSWGRKEGSRSPQFPLSGEKRHRDACKRTFVSHSNSSTVALVAGSANIRDQKVISDVTSGSEACSHT